MQITVFTLSLLIRFGLASLQRAPGKPYPPQISATGWPPRIILTWKTIAPEEELTPLTYDVICCTCNVMICRPLMNNLENGSKSFDLQEIPRCRQNSSKFASTLSCNVTGGVKNCKQTSSQLQQQNFYAVIKVSNSFGTSYSAVKYLDLFEESRCTKPSGFTGALTEKGVNLSWAHPLFMIGRDVIFEVLYAPRAIKCENVSRRNETLRNCKRFSCEAKNLLPNTEYTFYVSCSPAFYITEYRWGESSVFTIRTKDRAPSIFPTDVKKSNDTLFDKWKRNITLEWKFPSCATEWGGGEPQNFTIHYWLHNKTNSTEDTLKNRELRRNSKRLVIKDTSARKAVIGYLDRYSSYLVSIEMCSTSGCGPSSKQTYVKGFARYNDNEMSISDGTAISYWVILVAIILAVVVILLIAATLIRCFVFSKRSVYHANNSPRKSLKEVIRHLKPEETEFESTTHRRMERDINYDSQGSSRTDLQSSF